MFGTEYSVHLMSRLSYRINDISFRIVRDENGDSLRRSESLSKGCNDSHHTRRRENDRSKYSNLCIEN